MKRPPHKANNQNTGSLAILRSSHSKGPSTVFIQLVFKTFTTHPSHLKFYKCINQHPSPHTLESKRLFRLQANMICFSHQIFQRSDHICLARHHQPICICMGCCGNALRWWRSLSNMETLWSLPAKWQQKMYFGVCPLPAVLCVVLHITAQRLFRCRSITLDLTSSWWYSSSE